MCGTHVCVSFLFIFSFFFRVFYMKIKEYFKSKTTLKILQNMEISPIYVDVTLIGKSTLFFFDIQTRASPSVTMITKITDVGQKEKIGT